MNTFSQGHRCAYTFLEDASKANREAAYHARNAGYSATAVGNEKEAEKCDKRKQRHIEAAQKGEETDLHWKVDRHITKAEKSIAEAKETSRRRLDNLSLDRTISCHSHCCV